jgi:hypothetical protein
VLRRPRELHKTTAVKRRADLIMQLARDSRNVAPPAPPAPAAALSRRSLSRRPIIALNAAGQLRHLGDPLRRKEARSPA